MTINTYLENYEATKRRNELIQQSGIRPLSDHERIELNELIDSIYEFEEILINFD